MIHFVVIGGRSDAVTRLRPRLAGALEATRIHTGETIEAVTAAHNVAFAAIDAPDPVVPTRIACDGETLVAVNGPALAVEHDPAVVAEALRQLFAARGTEAVAPALQGAYNFVGANDQWGFRAFTSFSGLFPLYWQQTDGITVVSNRSTTVRAVLDNAGWSPSALAWVIGHANLFFDEMPAAGVSYLRPGVELRVNLADGRSTLVRAHDWIWPAPSEDPARADLSDDEWDEITEALIANFRVLGSYDARLMLSGGKDSRLCLALAKAAGLADRLRTVTTGPPNNAEALCAAEVAKRAGFEHKHAGQVTETGPKVVDDDAMRSAVLNARQWRLYRQHVHRYEAIVCPADGLTPEARDTVLSIKGFGGELYRGPGGHAKKFGKTDVESLQQMADMFVNYHQPHDPLGVLVPDVATAQAEQLRAWVYDTAAEIRFDLLPEKFFVDYRLGHWNGPLGQYTPGDIKINPLLSARAAQLCLSLSKHARSMDLLHFHVMRRTAPELLGVPIVNQAWHPALQELSPVLLPDEPWPAEVRVNARTLKPRRWAFLTEERDAVRALFEDAHETQMREIVDFGELLASIDDPASLSNVATKEILSNIAVALILLGRDVPVLDRIAPERQSVT